MTETEEKRPEQYYLEPGYIYWATQPTLISTVLGSSVSVCLFDRKQKIAGMNHFLFPRTGDKESATGRFGNAATLALIRMMIQNGSRASDLEAQILGGAYNRSVSKENIGLNNRKVARKVLGKYGVPVVSEDCGGEKGRKVIFTSHSGELAVMKVPRLRSCDWYPYENNR